MRCRIRGCRKGGSRVGYHGWCWMVWIRTCCLLWFVVVVSLPTCHGKIVRNDWRKDPPLPECSTTKSSKYDALYCWLATKLQVHLPSKSFSELFFTVEVSDLVCKDWKLSSLESSISGSGRDGVTIMFPKDLEMTCYGTYYVHPIWVSGDVTVQIVRGLEELEMEVWPMSKFGTVGTCNANSLQVSSLQLSGSISAWLLDWFHSTFANDVTSTLRSILCPQLQIHLPPLLQQQFIQPLSTYIHQLLHNTTTHTHTTNTSSIEWNRDLPKFANLLHQLQTNYIIDPYLHKGLLLRFLQDQFHYQPPSTINTTQCGFFYHGFQGNWLPQVIMNQLTTTNKNNNNNNKDDTNVQVSHTSELTTLELFQPHGNQSINLLTMDYPHGMDILMNHIPWSRYLFNETTTTLDDIPSSSIYIQFHQLTISQVILSFANWNQQQMIKDTTMGDVWSNPYSTIFQHVTLDTINVTAIVKQLSIHTNTGTDDAHLLEHDLDHLMNHILQIYIQHESPTITKLIWAILQGPIRSYINHNYLQPKPNYSSIIPPDDGRQSTIITQEKKNQEPIIMTNVKYSIHHLSTLEKVLKCRWKVLQPFLNHYFEQTILSTTKKDDNNKSHIVSLSQWQLSFIQFPEIGTIDSLDILEQVDRFHFESKLKMSYQCPNYDYVPSSSTLLSTIDKKKQSDKKSATTIADSCGREDNKAFTIIIGLTNGKTKDTIQLTILLQDIFIFLGNAFKYQWDLFQNLNLHDVLESPFLQLLLKPLQNAGLYGLSKNSIGNVAMNMTYYNYQTKTTKTMSSPSSNTNDGNDELSDIWEIIVNVVQDVINGYLEINLFQIYSQDEEFSNTNTTIKSSNNTLHMTAPSNERSYDHMQMIMIVVISCILGSTNILAILFLYFKQKKNDYSDEEPTIIEVDDIIEDSLETEKEYTPPPQNLMFHEKTYPFIRYLVPVLIVFTIFLFFISTLAKGALLGVGGDAPGMGIVGPINIFEFTLIKTLEKMWKNKIYLLFFIIFIFSLIWPYIKLILMMVAWVIPEQSFGLKRREDLLFWLDALGKLSLVDIFALVVFMAIFRFQVPLPGGVIVETFIIPQFGFHCFLYATVMSLIIGHCATFVHRRTMEPIFEGNRHRLSSIRTHRFKGRVAGTYMKFSKFFQAVLVFLIILDVLMLSLSIFRKVFVVKVGGVPGVLMGYPQNTKMESIWSFGTAITMAVPKIIPSVRMIQLVYFFFAVVMPYASIAVVAVLYLVPVSVQAQRRIYSLAEICNAWSAIEVFLLASLVSILQIGKLVKGIRHHNCEAFEKVLKKYYFDQLIGTTKCIDLSSSMTSEAALLYVAVGIHILLIHFFLKVSHRALMDRIEREGTFEEKNHSSHEESGGFLMWFAKTWLGKIFFTDYTDPEETTTP